MTGSTPANSARTLSSHGGGPEGVPPPASRTDRTHSLPTLSGLMPRRCGTPCSDKACAPIQDMTKSPQVNPAHTPSPLGGGPEGVFPSGLPSRPHSSLPTLSGLTPRRCGTPCDDRASAFIQNMTGSTQVNPALTLSSHGGGPDGVSPSDLPSRPHSSFQTLSGLTPGCCGTPCDDRSCAPIQNMTGSTPANSARTPSSHGGGPEGVPPSGLPSRPHSSLPTLSGLTPRRCGTPLWR